MGPNRLVTGRSVVAFGPKDRDHILQALQVEVSTFYSLTEVSSKVSHFAIKERGTQKHTHTQSAKLHECQPAAGRGGCLIFARFLLNSQKAHGDLSWPKICNGKTKGLANRSQKQYPSIISGQAILGTQRYFAKAFLMILFMHLRRGDFMYTAILLKGYTLYTYTIHLQ